jgi:hypothetical protein
MVCLEPGLYVRIVEMRGERAPLPRPLASGFNEDTAYRVLGLHSASETSEAYLILSNDRDELWFISNKHARSVALRAGDRALRLPLAAAEPPIDGGDRLATGARVPGRSAAAHAAAA